VYEVRNLAGERFALKCLRPELAGSAKRKRFKNEIDFCHRKRHKNLLQVIDYGVSNTGDTEVPFYVMELYSRTLRDLLNDRIQPENVLPIFNQLLDGVEAAHLLGVIHRDIKPENILHDPGADTFVVADFGIAHFEEDAIATAVETKVADKLLNITYAAPEQRRRGQAVNQSADIFALGQILNEMFTGFVPDGAGHATIGQVAPNYSYLDSLVEKMRQQSPASRPSDIAAIKAELIARGNAFIARQVLDAKKQEVIPQSSPETVEEVRITAVKWSNGTLELSLNRRPGSEWIKYFQNPNTNIQYVLGASPHEYAFRDKSVVLRVEERHAQNAINQFKTWSPLATQRLQLQLIQLAKDHETAERKRLQEEISAAERDSRVNSSLKF
jgi:serine/threonine protein kinase